jgi:dihydrofolate reductase
MPMRPVLYRVAASLDGYIAGPRGEVDWIVGNGGADLAALYDEVDTVLLGRRTYELTLRPGAPPWPAGWRLYVFSRTLSAEPHARVRVVSTGAAETVAGLRADTGKKIWLFGGGGLFRSLLEAGQVDEVEVAVMPVVLGGGIPLLAVRAGANPTRLALTAMKASPKGIVTLRYAVGEGQAR